MPESKPKPKQKSIMQDITDGKVKTANKADKQKIMKYCLIVGVPVVLLCIVAVIVGTLVK